MDKLFGMGKSLLGGGGSKKNGTSNMMDENGNNLLDSVNPMAMFKSLDKNGDGKSIRRFFCLKFKFEIFNINKNN